jgi:hypothetical protein
MISPARALGLLNLEGCDPEFSFAGFHYARDKDLVIKATQLETNNEFGPSGKTNEPITSETEWEKI